MDPKWLIVKLVVLKGCNGTWDAVRGWIGVVSHHLRSLLSNIELIVSCAS